MDATDVKNSWTSKISIPTFKSSSPKVSSLQSQKNLNTDEVEDDDSLQGAENESDAKPQVPMRKRRRVARACDECRRQKIKCDGRQPCTHCTGYSYDCTYDPPSHRRRNPTPQYLEALEQRLQKAEAILRSVLPHIDIDDPIYAAQSVEQIVEGNRAAFAKSRHLQQRCDDDDAQLCSMVDRTRLLDLDGTGYHDYHGKSSGYSFIHMFLPTFGEDFLQLPPQSENRNHVRAQRFPTSLHLSTLEADLSVNNDLPPQDIAIELCRNAIDDCCAPQRPFHRPTFFRRLSAVYSVSPKNYTSDHVKFLPLLYSAMAVGCLCGKFDGEKTEPDKQGYKFAIEKGYQYFNIAKSMLDTTDCRDLPSIQAVMLMVLFLQGTANFAACYAYIGLALRACCRLGMHRKITAKFDVIEQEERKRLFWQVRKLDVCAAAMLGLPMMLSNDEIDQDLPLEVFDEDMTQNGMVSISQETFPLMKATNAHTRLVRILQKVVYYVYPVKHSSEGSVSGECTISHNLVRGLECDMQNWIDELPLQLKPSDNTDIELSRVQRLLRISYFYVQLMIYRPFLYYVAPAHQTARTDMRCFAYAAACVRVARYIVHAMAEMKRRDLLTGSYWLEVYTTHLAILSLLYFVLENPASTKAKEILKDAVEGRDTLAYLATCSMAADRCASSLARLFEVLPDKLNERRSSLRTMPNTTKKRPFSARDQPLSANTLDVNMVMPAHTWTMPQDT